MQSSEHLIPLCSTLGILSAMLTMLFALASSLAPPTFVWAPTEGHRSIIYHHGQLVNTPSSSRQNAKHGEVFSLLYRYGRAGKTIYCIVH